MSDHIELAPPARAPAYLLWENGAAYGRNGTVWFKWYEPEEAPAVKPRGYVSRFQVPTAVLMPKNRAIGIDFCDRLAGLLPKLDDAQAATLARWLSRASAELDADPEMSSLVLTGWRYGEVREAERFARQMLKGSIR